VNPIFFEMKNNLLVLLMMHWARIVTKGTAGMEHIDANGGGQV
jgi:hypothetical protein